MLRSMILTAAALIVLPAADATQAVTAADRDWTGWLGPERNGWVDDFEPPAQWPAELEQVWQSGVGTGYGSPLVAGGRVFQHGRQGEEEVVWCLDLESGDVQWRESYAAPFEIGGGAQFHGKGPKSCPALANGRLFTLSITGVLSAWDADSGDLLWQHDFGDRFEKTHPYWGASTSPLVDGDRVIVHFGADDQGALIALDVETGDVVWSHGNDGASYASPILVEIAGIRQIVELNMRALVSVNSESGEFLWEHPYPQVTTDQNMVTPAFHDGLVLQGGENRGILCIEPWVERGVWTVDERWHQEDVALDMSTAVMNGDLLYGFSHYSSGRLFCLDPQTGDVRWQGPQREGQNVTFLAIPDHVVALTDGGKLQIIAATGDEFKVVASYQVSESPTWAPPVLLESGVLVKDLETLTLWSWPRTADRTTSAR